MKTTPASPFATFEFPAYTPTHKPEILPRPQGNLPSEQGGVFGQDCCCIGHVRRPDDGGPRGAQPVGNREVTGEVSKAVVKEGEDAAAAIREAVGDPKADVREIQPQRAPSWQSFLQLLQAR